MTRCMFLILAAAVSATAADGVIRRLVWQVETSDPVERHWALTYGETVDFEVQYLDHRRPMDLAGGSVVLHARTNGMDTGLSYQATGSVMSAQGWATVRVAVDDLLPAGLTAASYRIAVTKGGSTNLLAAAGTFRLTGSGAGLAGAALPTPVAMEIRAEMAAATNQVMALLGPRITTLESGTNNWSAAFSWGPHFAAGYLVPADISGLATTQQVAQAVSPLGPRIAALEGGTNAWQTAYSWGDHALAGYLTNETDAIALAVMATNRTTVVFNPTNSNEFTDGAMRVWRISTVTNTFIGWSVAIETPISICGEIIQPSTNQWPGIPYPLWTDSALSFTQFITNYPAGSTQPMVVWYYYRTGSASPHEVHFSSPAEESSASWYTNYQSASATNSVRVLFGRDDLSPTWSDPVYMVYGTNTTVSVVTSQVATVAWESDLAVFATTQQVADAVAPLATAEQAAAIVHNATNALVQTYLLGSNAWMIVSNDVLRIWQISPTNSLQTNLLWQSGDAFPPAATQTLWSAVLQLTQDLDAKGGRAWGNYAPDGSDNPDPAYMTFLNAPAAVFASGAQWSTYGTYAVLTATGTVAFASGGDGQFRIGPNSTNWFGYVQGGSVTVGAVPDSLAVTGGGETGGYAEIVYAYSGGDFPALWFTPSLSLDFTEVSGAVWVDNLDGTATATAPAESAGGFWFATTTVTLDNYFKSTMPARLDGGVVGSTNALPVVYDSVITISAGGKNYRIPAQEIE